MTEHDWHAVEASLTTESRQVAPARGLDAAEASVTRNGRCHRIDATHLVPGDVVHLGSGDKIPADLRLIGGCDLRIAEAALTGVSVPVDKHHATLPADTPLADRWNLAYTATLVVLSPADSRSGPLPKKAEIGASLETLGIISPCSPTLMVVGLSARDGCSGM